MIEEIFILLIQVRNNGFIELDSIHTKRNREQAIQGEERYRNLEYLLNQGFLSRIKDTYIITEYGYMVAQYKSWSEYLAHQKELMNRKIAKENNDLKISEFQVRTTYLPHYLSVISILFSIIVFIYTIRKDYNDYEHTTKDIKTTKQVNEKKPNTILTKKAVDSVK